MTKGHETRTNRCPSFEPLLASCFFTPSLATPAPGLPVRSRCAQQRAPEQERDVDMFMQRTRLDTSHIFICFPPSSRSSGTKDCAENARSASSVVRHVLSECVRQEVPFETRRSGFRMPLKGDAMNTSPNTAPDKNDSEVGILTIIPAGGLMVRGSTRSYPSSAAHKLLADAIPTLNYLFPQKSLLKKVSISPRIPARVQYLRNDTSI